MAAERVFVDTWAWLVLANDRDPAFGSVSRLRSSTAGQPGAWVTTDYVLDETLTRLFALAPFAQARRFTESCGVTGIVLTKLDGTAKGGVVIAIARELNLPIRYVGIGEKIDDLLPFDAESFASSIFET